MFRRCVFNRWTKKQPSSPSFRPRCHHRTQATAERPKNSSRSPLPPKPKVWRQLVALAIVGIPVLFTAYYVLDQDSPSFESFGKYKLISKEPVSSSAAIFHLEPQNGVQETERYKEIWRQGIWNVQFKQPQLQIIRAYTPLPPSTFDEKNLDTTSPLRFLIRNDPHGEVSGYLHRLPTDSTIEVRGPNLEHAVGKDVKEVIFLAGGTGIAPALQVAHALFSGLDGTQAGEKKLRILWANRKREDCTGAPNRAATQADSSSWLNWFSRIEPPKPAQDPDLIPNAIVHHLSVLQARYPDRILVSYFIDEENILIDSNAISNVLSYPSSSTTAEESIHSIKKEIIISGPPGFIGYLAGPKVWQNGTEEQGPLRGLVGAELMRRKDLGDVKVWKV